MFYRANFIYHKQLESRFWDSDCCMRPVVRAALLAVVNQVMAAFRNINLSFDMRDVCDVFVHGSITNYYYDKHSDIDMCFVCDFSRIKRDMPHQNVDLLLKSIAYSVLAETKPRIFGRRIDIEFVDVRYQQYGPNFYKVGGAYSVLSDKWIRRTIRVMPEELKQIKQQARIIYNGMRRQVIDVLARQVDYKQVEALTNHLMRERKSAYAASPEQPITPYVVAYRMLRDSKLLGRAYEHALKLRAKNPQ